MLFASAFLFSFPAQGQARALSPIVVEVEEELSWAGGGQTRDDKDLYLRLWRDGQVEWSQRGIADLRSAKIPLEQVAAIVARIDSVNPKSIQSKMGPYNVYTDTFVDLHFPMKPAVPVTRV